MKKLLLLPIIFCMSLLSACAIQIPVDVASGVIFASDSVDSMQAEVGEYSLNQDVLADLDALQDDIQNTITTGEGVEKIDDYYSRSLAIYAVLKTEAKARLDEFAPSQLERLSALDAELVALNASVLALKESVVNEAVNNIEVLQTIQRAAIILSYVKGF